MKLFKREKIDHLIEILFLLIWCLKWKLHMSLANVNFHSHWIEYARGQSTDSLKFQLNNHLISLIQKPTVLFTVRDTINWTWKLGQFSKHSKMFSFHLNLSSCQHSLSRLWSKRNFSARLININWNHQFGKYLQTEQTKPANTFNLMKFGTFICLDSIILVWFIELNNIFGWWIEYQTNHKLSKWNI